MISFSQFAMMYEVINSLIIIYFNTNLISVGAEAFHNSKGI